MSMRSWFTFAAVTLLLGFVSACQALPGPSDKIAHLRSEIADPASSHVFVVAHRGCWETAPENSILAIQTCIEAGVDMVELDVRRTRDGVLVLMHDATLDRTTDLVGPVTEVTWQTLKTARLKRGAGGLIGFVDERQIKVPTLKLALLAAKDQILINIDAKSDLHEAIFEIVEETGTQNQVLMKMRAAPDDARLAKTDFIERSLFMPIIGQCEAEPAPDRYCVDDLGSSYSAFLPLNPVAFEIVYTADGFLVSALPQITQDARVWVNTLQPRHAAGRTDEIALHDPDAVWGFLLDHGVTMIQTDYPLQLVQFLEDRDTIQSERSVTSHVQEN